VVVAFAAWAILSERPSARIIVAVPIVFTGAVLISGVLEAGAYGDDPVRGTIYGVLTTFAYSGFILLLRQSNSDIRRPAGALFDASLVATVVSAAVGASYGAVDLLPDWPAHGWLVLLALSSQVMGWLLISISLPRLPAALTSVILLIQPVMAVALAALIVDENPSTVQILGVLIVLVGVVYATSRGGRREPVPAT
jgi:drug/metabolite transporter (DMT)-like permease